MELKYIKKDNESIRKIKEWELRVGVARKAADCGHGNSGRVPMKERKGS